MTVPKINSAHGSDTRNTLNRAIEVLNQQGLTIQDLVANGQLTPAQYTELIKVVNGLLKSGEIGYYDLNDSLRSNVDSIADKINKGQVTADDFNKNGRLLDGTFFTSDFLAQLNKGTIEVTNLLDDSVENRHLVNGAVDYENISSDGVEDLNFESAIREFFGVGKNLILNPPGEIPFTTYASQVNDEYYHSLQSVSLPITSMSEKKTITLASGRGYFFYRLNVVGELLNKRVLSFIVQNSNPEATVSLRFLDSSFTQIGSFIFPERKKFNIYGVENINIPSNSSVVEFRVDNRSSSSSATIINPIVVASPRINLRDGYINDLESELKRVESDLEKYKIDDADKLPPIKVKPPNNFSLKNTEISDRIYFDGKDTFTTDYDVSESKRDVGTVYYVDFENGINSNDGLSPQKPLKSIGSAINKADVGEIKLKGGNHFRYGSSWFTVNKNINITSYDGVARLLPADKLTWSKTSGYTNVWEISRPATGKVIDLTRTDGDGYLEYKSVSTLTQVNSTADSWHTAEGKVYVHAKAKPSPDEIIALISAQNILTTNDITYLYLENIEVIGGARPVRTVANGIRFYAKNCKFIHGLQVNANGLEIVGGVSSICQNVIASKNPMDGFNYHIGTNGSKPYMIEIDCKGVDNGEWKGTNGSRSDNGTTLHDGLKGIRLNGYYGYNDGGNIADVNAGTESWNLNCIAFDSYQDYDIIVNGGTKIFLDNVSTIGSTTSIISQSIDDKVYIRRGEFGVKEIAGTEISY